VHIRIIVGRTQLLQECEGQYDFQRGAVLAMEQAVAGYDLDNIVKMKKNMNCCFQ